MAYPSALSLVRICSESTRAFGHPSETNPTLGDAAAASGRGRILAMAIQGAIVRCKKISAAMRMLQCFRASALFFFVGRRLSARGEVGERKRGEQTACLILHALLHIHEQFSVLFEVVAEHALHRRSLHLQELFPEVRRQ